jgi:hypothetical protein
MFTSVNILEYWKPEANVTPNDNVLHIFCARSAMLEWKQMIRSRDPCHCKKLFWEFVTLFYQSGHALDERFHYKRVSWKPLMVILESSNFVAEFWSMLSNCLRVNEKLSHYGNLRCLMSLDASIVAAISFIHWRLPYLRRRHGLQLWKQWPSSDLHTSIEKIIVRVTLPPISWRKYILLQENGTHETSTTALWCQMFTFFWYVERRRANLGEALTWPLDSSTILNVSAVYLWQIKSR